ncbi:MAG TPA: GNAT family N-acetyltransferase [Candidatus Bathyarchaeia archaeon]|nr:GNAT family N-acetyltransferase [Candidatus Bathyarchaeia archaeon]
MNSAQIVVRELNPDTLSDFLNLFDKAFSDFPDWAGCYCGFYETEEKDWDSSEKASQEHRKWKSEQITNGRAGGLLAYINGRAVGWCNAQPRARFANMRSYEVAVTDPNEPVGSIMCFLVSPDHRGKGVGTALLREACRMFSRDGLTVAEAYPRTSSKQSGVPWAEENYKGSLSMYLNNGFTVHRQLERFSIVRRQL